MDNNDLNNAKIGDKIAVKGSYRHQHSPLFYFFTVERITATQVICTNDVRFKKDSGKKLGTTAYDYGFISRGVKLRPSGRRYKPHRISDYC